MSETTSLDEAIELVKFAAPFRNYPGTGAIWCGRNNDLADGSFTDWALGRAVAMILQAVADGQLAPKMAKGEIKESAS